MLKLSEYYNDSFSCHSLGSHPVDLPFGWFWAWSPWQHCQYRISSTEVCFQEFVLRSWLLWYIWFIWCLSNLECSYIFVLSFNLFILILLEFGICFCTLILINFRFSQINLCDCNVLRGDDSSIDYYSQDGCFVESYSQDYAKTRMALIVFRQRLLMCFFILIDCTFILC